MFFFEKKNQKTFAPFGAGLTRSRLRTPFMAAEAGHSTSATILKLVILILILMGCFIGRQASADSVSSICAPGAQYFELRTFDGGFSNDHVLKSNDDDDVTFSIENFHTWLKNPISCEIANLFGYSHTIEVRAVNYFPGSNAMCGAEENATIQILLDGNVIRSQDFVYGLCQPMETFVEMNGADLFFCSIPDLLGVAGVGDLPDWTTRKDAKGQISIDCQRLDILAIDVKKK